MLSEINTSILECARIIASGWTRQPENSGIGPPILGYLGSVMNKYGRKVNEYGEQVDEYGK